MNENNLEDYLFELRYHILEAPFDRTLMIQFIKKIYERARVDTLLQQIVDESENMGLYDENH